MGLFFIAICFANKINNIKNRAPPKGRRLFLKKMLIFGHFPKENNIKTTYKLPQNNIKTTPKLLEQLQSPPSLHNVENYLNTTQKLPQNYLKTTQKLAQNYLTTTQKLPQNYLKTTPIFLEQVQPPRSPHNLSKRKPKHEEKKYPNTFGKFVKCPNISSFFLRMTSLEVSGGIGHFSNLSLWHATTKTQAYFGVFDFLRFFPLQKNDFTPVKSHLKNTIRNPFFKSHFLGQNTQKKI